MWGRPAASPSAKSIQEDEISLAVIMAGRMKKFSEHTSTIPEVMDSSTLNFNPNLSFRDFFPWGEPVTPSGEC